MDFCRGTIKISVVSYLENGSILEVCHWSFTLQPPPWIALEMREKYEPWVCMCCTEFCTYFEQNSARKLDFYPVDTSYEPTGVEINYAVHFSLHSAIGADTQ